MALQKLIDDTIKAEMEHFYKTWVIRSKGMRDNYYTTEEYFKKHGVGNFQFETCWAYIEYKKWIDTDVYVSDFEYIKNIFLQDILNGFDSRMEEIINMTDDDDEDFDKWIGVREHFRNLKTDTEKINYLEQEYKNNWYYPTFSHLWLYDRFEDRIV
jgi:hypothetical protein